MRFIVLAVTFLFFTQGLQAKKSAKADSLRLVLEKATEDSTRMQLRIAIGKAAWIMRVSYWDSISNDAAKLSLPKYQAEAINNTGFLLLNMGKIDSAMNKFEKAIAIQEKVGDKRGVAQSLINLATAYNVLGNIDMALNKLNESYKAICKTKDTLIMASTLNNMAYMSNRQGNIPRALKLYMQSLQLQEAIDDPRGIADGLGNIGALYRQQEEWEQALKYYDRAIAIYKDIGDDKGITRIKHNMARIHYDNGDYEKAAQLAKEAMEIENRTGNRISLSYSYSVLGNVFAKQGKIEEGLTYLQKALEIREEYRDKKAITMTLANMAALYFENGSLKEAEANGLKALEMAKQIKDVEHERDASEVLSMVYDKQGKLGLAYQYYKEFMVLRDSINNDKNSRLTIRQQMGYEYEKEKALAEKENEKKLAVAAEREERQKVVSYSIGIGLAMVILFSIFVVNQLRKSKKQNRIIAQEKERVEYHKGIVEEKNIEITDSINYAKRIQEAILPPDKLVKEFLTDSFILYKPKAIVAGDFYWMESKGDSVIFAAADCTGHGVPGAMVSVVCHNALNRSVREFGLTDPGEILNKVRELVVETFEKSEEQVHDGMDVALVNYNTATKELLYAGANNPLWLVKPIDNNVTEIDVVGKTHYLHELKADRQPIGNYGEEQPFTTNKLKLQPGETIYLFSDGFADQFGGDKGKKLKAKPFKELLLSLQQESMETQRLKLNTAFEEWRAGFEQIDDVCVIGVRV